MEPASAKKNWIFWNGSASARCGCAGPIGFFMTASHCPLQAKTGSIPNAAPRKFFREYRKRKLSADSPNQRKLEISPGTFHLTEAANEANATRLPADFAEELKIDYAKTKLHDRISWSAAAVLPSRYLLAGGTSGKRRLECHGTPCSSTCTVFRGRPKSTIP